MNLDIFFLQNVLLEMYTQLEHITVQEQKL